MNLVEKRFEQEMHCCGHPDEQAHVHLRVFDGGGGPYLVLTAHHWAIDSESQLDELVAELRAMLPKDLGP